MQRISLRTSLCLSSLPQVRGCAGLCCLKSQVWRVWTVSHHLFPVLSPLCDGATCAGCASHPGWALSVSAWHPCSGCKWEGSCMVPGHCPELLCETPITPAWVGEVRGAPGCHITARGDTAWKHLSHSPGKLQGAVLVRA